MLAKLLKNVYATYDYLFSRQVFFKWNRFLYNLSIRGLGVLTDADRAEAHFLKAYLSKEKQGLVVFDVGGNVGDYAVMVKSIAPNARILSFEPSPKTYLKLSERGAENGFEAYRFALGNQIGKVSFFDYEGDSETGSEHASLYKEVIEGVHHGKSQEFEVDITTIDAFVMEHKIIHINLLKIDTEGNEMDVLLGSQKSLSEGMIDAVQFEFNEMNVVSRTFLKDFIKLMPNYTFYRLLKDGYIKIDKYFSGYHEIFAWQNIIAIREGIILQR